MKKKNILILVLFLCIAVVIVIILCGRNNNKGLEGTWMWDGGEMTISGSSGKFSEITSGLWFNALNQQFVSIGSSKLRNINQIEDNKWTCSQIGACPNGDKVNSIFWVDNCTVSISTNRDTLKVVGDLPACGNTPGGEGTIIYIRKKQ